MQSDSIFHVSLTTFCTLCHFVVCCDDIHLYSCIYQDDCTCNMFLAYFFNYKYCIYIFIYIYKFTSSPLVDWYKYPCTFKTNDSKVALLNSLNINTCLLLGPINLGQTIKTSLGNHRKLRCIVFLKMQQSMIELLDNIRLSGVCCWGL